MINGNSINFQFGKEATYGTAASPTVKLNITSESLNDAYDKTEEGLLTGGIGGGAVETMAVSASGDFSTLAKPTSFGYILKGVLGTENVSAGSAEDTYDHVFTPVGNGESDYLPAWTFTIDRKAAVKAYIGMIFDSLSLSAVAGDRVNATVSVLGQKVATGTIGSTLVDTGDSEHSFKFYQGKIKINNEDFADVTSINFDYANNADNSIQTTETGLYHKQPQQGRRECTATLDVLYSSSSETLRNNYWCEDATVTFEATFTDESGNILKIELPKAQISEMAQANATGADTMSQSVTIKAIDNTTAFVKVTLTNTKETAY